jgi:hypothetical protein
MGKVKDYLKILKRPYLDARDVQNVLEISYSEAIGIIKIAKRRDMKNDIPTNFRVKASIDSIIEVIDIDENVFLEKLKKYCSNTK